MESTWQPPQTPRHLALSIGIPGQFMATLQRAGD